VYIKRLELTNFKSFGGTTEIPLLSGFTVVSGPNGSGKSNLIDALLFCLGLAGSKGMRAERLPDLVNHTQSSRNRSTIEASVTVTFDLSDEADLLTEVEESFNSSNGASSKGNSLNGNGSASNDTNGNGANGSEANSHSPMPINGEWSVTRKLRVT
jgi:chromosome segregation protein